MADQADRHHMHECEARHWLREKITTKRGAAAAERLIEEMRRQWRRRGEWLT